MSIATTELFRFDNSFARELPELYVEWQAAEVPAPRLLVLNDELARARVSIPRSCGRPNGVCCSPATKAGRRHPDRDGVRRTPVRQLRPPAGRRPGAAARRGGRQRGRRRDLHLKGSGRHPFARGGDGKAAVGPMLRELLIGEAMHALGIPDDARAGGRRHRREHIARACCRARCSRGSPRATCGSARSSSPRGWRRRACCASSPTTRSPATTPTSPTPSSPTSASRAGRRAQASLIARWMIVGFIHGVMNTDNMTISGRDDRLRPVRVHGRLRPGDRVQLDRPRRPLRLRQPASIAQWNLARLGRDAAAASMTTPTPPSPRPPTCCRAFPRFSVHWLAGMRAKLGLKVAEDDAVDLRRSARPAARDKARLHLAFRAPWPQGRRREAARVVRPARRSSRGSRAGRPDSPARDVQPAGRGDGRGNPVYIPRNHLVEEALAAATAGDLEPFERSSPSSPSHSTP